MHDSVRFIARNFDANLASNWFAVPVWMAQIWSVQVVVKIAITNCILEVMLSNDGVTAASPAPVLEFTAAGMKTGIDAGGLGVAFLLFRVQNKADNASERVDVIFVGRTDSGRPGMPATLQDAMNIPTIELGTKGD